jgi:hypothetical protein
MASKKQLGRPTKFTPKLSIEICNRMMDGESLRLICRDKKMPSRQSVHTWLLEGANKETHPLKAIFLYRYELAFEIRAENMFDEILEIADDGRNDWMEKEGRDGQINIVCDKEHIQRSRLRADVRKWKLSKMLPKKFGDRIQQDISGSLNHGGEYISKIANNSSKVVDFLSELKKKVLDK